MNISCTDHLQDMVPLYDTIAKIKGNFEIQRLSQPRYKDLNFVWIHFGEIIKTPILVQFM